jgi:hypothetical protein
MSAVWPYLAAIIPTILVAILFYFLIKGMLEGDRRERLAQKRFEEEQDRRAAAASRGTGTATPPPAAPPAPAPGNADDASDGPSDIPGNTSPQS